MFQLSSFNNEYPIQNRYYLHTLVCTYIEDNTVWLKSETYPISDTTLLYKLDRKSNKLYVFNTKVQAYDLVSPDGEGSLSEEGVVAKYKSEGVTVIYDYLE